MKKKLLLITSVIAILVVAAIGLVACTSSPGEFAKQLGDAKHFTINIISDGMEIEMIYDNGNVATSTKQDDSLTFAVYMVKNKDDVSVYTYTSILKTWTKTTVAIDSDQYTEILAQVQAQFKDLAEDIKEDSLIQEGSYWYEKNADGTANKTTRMKISSSTLEMQMQNTDKDGNITYTTVATLKLSGTVKVPSDAK